MEGRLRVGGVVAVRVGAVGRGGGVVRVGAVGRGGGAERVRVAGMREGLVSGGEGLGAACGEGYEDEDDEGDCDDWEDGDLDALSGYAERRRVDGGMRAMWGWLRVWAGWDGVTAAMGAVGG